MEKHELHAGALKVEPFNTITCPGDVRGTVDQPDGCICFAPPAICSAGPDCTRQSQ